MVNRNRLTVALLLTAGFVFSLLFARQLVLTKNLPREQFTDRPLRVLTTAALVSSRGPLEAIFKAFEAERRVKLEVTVAEPAFLLERLKNGGVFDLVLGLDPLARGRAGAEVRWRKLDVDTAGWFETPARASDDGLVALDWSPLAFVHRVDNQPVPKSFAELTSADYRRQFTVPDPRATAVGHQFAAWVAALGSPAAWLKEFAPNVLTITPSWSAAYGLFEQKRTRFVWTFLTSLAFHWGTAGDRGFAALILPEGHPAHVDFAGVPDACVACDLGRDLLGELLTPRAQAALMARNFMMPVRADVTKDTIFAELPPVKIVPTRGDVDHAAWAAAFGR